MGIGLYFAKEQIKVTDFLLHRAYSMNNEQEEISRMILDHLRENPDAGDTIEGISEWWLNFKKIEISVDEVSKTLEELFEKGLIKRVNVGNNPLIYKVKKGKLF
jgi:DNA-binding Lrp family transcriptional regulator